MLRRILLTLLAALPLTIGSAQQATTYQMNREHSGYTKFANALTFPLTKKWSIGMPDLISYPLIADGKVYVTTRGINGGYGTVLFAINAVNGTKLWRKNIPGTYFWSGLAYGNGKVYVINFDGKMRCFDGATGNLAWQRQLPGQYAFSSAPTYSNGRLYVGGAGSGGTLYCLNPVTGAVLWMSSVANGDQSSPACTDMEVFVSYAGNQTYSFHAITGDQIWHYNTGISGGGGKTTALSVLGLHTRDYDDNLILNSATGDLKGRYLSYVIPALVQRWRYTLWNGVLQGKDLSKAFAPWSFSGDGNLCTAPIIVGKVLFMASTAGKFYALDRETGATLWSTGLGYGVEWPDEQNVSQPLTGMAAGEGIIVIPAGKRLIAYGN